MAARVYTIGDLSIPYDAFFSDFLGSTLIIVAALPLSIAIPDFFHFDEDSRFAVHKLVKIPDGAIAT